MHNYIFLNEVVYSKDGSSKIFILFQVKSIDWKKYQLSKHNLLHFMFLQLRNKIISAIIKKVLSIMVLALLLDLSNLRNYVFLGYLKLIVNCMNVFKFISITIGIRFLRQCAQDHCIIERQMNFYHQFFQHSHIN